MAVDGQSWQQPYTERMDRVDEQRAWGDVSERKHKISKTRLKQGHLQHLYVRKATLLEKPRPLLANSDSEEPLLTNAHSMGNKHGKSEICAHLQGHNLAGITET